MIAKSRGEVEVHKAVFGTFTNDLKRLRRWLKDFKLRRVAMESTGVYWIPVWNVLERGNWFDLVLVNPAHVKALPGKKTDQMDCERIAELLQYGLLRSSFIPPRETRELRELLRYRVGLKQDYNRIHNRIHRLLETANLKLSSVVSDILGLTGRTILHAIAAGQTDPGWLADYARGSLRGKRHALELALTGDITEHFKFMLQQLLDDVQYVLDRIAKLERAIEDHMQAHQELITRLCTIPGVDRVGAWTLIAEIGTDMSVFGDAAHLCSWAAVCPGNNESAGKRQSGRTGKGNRYLRRGLCQCAWAVSHCKNNYLTALFYRISGRRGIKKAIVAVCHRLLVIAFHIIRDGTSYRELGGNFFDRLQPARTRRRLTHRLEQLGYEVTLVPRATVPLQPAPKKKLGRPCKCEERRLDCKHRPLSPEGF
jgi:transposase